MKKAHYRIICLNLALLFSLLFSIPAYAQMTPINDEGTIEAPRWALSSNEYSAGHDATERIALERHENSEKGMDDDYDISSPSNLGKHVLKSSSPKMLRGTSSYEISVGGTSFQSDEVYSGSGWSYENGALTLNNYNGTSIYASGDLVIYSFGEVSIKGESGVYGGVGIGTSGALTLFHFGSIHVSGGNGTVSGGDAIIANGLSSFLVSGTSSFTGGASSNGNGGNGVNAETVYVYNIAANNPPVLVCTGGTGSASNRGVGGCGIMADNIYIGANASLIGGSGYVAAPAVYFRYSCSFGVANIELAGGKNGSNIYADAIQYSESSSQKWYYSLHTTVQGDKSSISITINQYRLSLFGNGGLRNGRTFTDMIDYYPKSYNLLDYTFVQDGYTQVAWECSGDMLPLNSVFTPDKNAELYAFWEESVAGDILLNGLGGKLSNGEMWQRYHGEPSIILPYGLDYTDYNNQEYSSKLVGWNTLSSVSEDLNGVMNGTWFAGGSTVNSNPSSATILFAPNMYGSYIVYHTEKGTPVAGGNEFVQHKYEASCSDLELYIVDAEEYMTTPDGYRFMGWSSTPNGSVLYSTNDCVVVTEGNPLHLYAVWEPIEFKYVLQDCNALVNTQLNSIKLQLSHAWFEQYNPQEIICALYDANGKMLDSAIYSTESYNVFGAITLYYTGVELPQLKLFPIANGNMPTGPKLEMDLINMTPSE